MKRQRSRASILLLPALALLLYHPPAHAVIPSAIGPMQALMAILPHLLALLGLAVVALAKPSTYKTLARYFWTHKAMTSGFFGCVALYFFHGDKLFGERKVVVTEQVGAPWLAFRGGADRCGAVPGARGPCDDAKILWTARLESGSALRRVDSSCAVVGNRVYVGSAVQSVFKSYGTLHCLDADTGAEVWAYTGEGELDPPIKPVFSSPTVGEFEGKKFLVCGEGYHVDEECRIICIDLPEKAGDAPKLRWARPTTSHVETSLCAFEGKVYAGAGDDGYWCFDLKTGDTLWHIDGAEYYYVKTNVNADALAKLEGKTVFANGKPSRVWIDKGTDKSEILLDVNASGEASVPHSIVKDLQKGLTVVGKVEINPEAAKRVENSSPVRIKVERFYDDAESPPIGVRLPKDPSKPSGDTEARLFFGSGIGGNAVYCVDAETGKEIWKYKTPYPAFSPPAVVDGRVYVGVSNGTFVASDKNPAGGVICINAYNGQEIWQAATADGVLTAVAVKNGFAYATCRDGNVYIVDANGKVVNRVATGATIVSSPAVTENSVFVANDAGKIIAIDRKTNAFQWSNTLTPGSAIYSSPAVAGNKLFIGTQSRGVICLVEIPKNKAAKKPRAWQGPGGGADRTGLADDNGLPMVSGDQAHVAESIPLKISGGTLAVNGNNIFLPAIDEQKNPGKACIAKIDTEAKSDRVMFAPVTSTVKSMAASGSNIFLQCATEKGDVIEALLHLVAYQIPRESHPQPIKVFDSLWTNSNPSGEILCATESGLLTRVQSANYCLDYGGGTYVYSVTNVEAVGAASAHNLVLISAKTPKPQILCLSDLDGKQFWSADLPATPTTPPTISNGKVFVAYGEKDKARLAAFSLIDGKKLWENDCEIAEAPTGYLAANNDYVVFSVAAGNVFAVKAMTGELIQQALAGPGAVPPLLYQNVMIIAAENRVGAYDISGGKFLWNLAEQDKLGKILAPPVAVGESIWISTEKMGLLKIGAPKSTIENAEKNKK